MYIHRRREDMLYQDVSSALDVYQEFEAMSVAGYRAEEDPGADPGHYPKIP